MDPLAELGRALRAEGYSFVTPTPETHRRVLAHRGEGATLRDIFGWNIPRERLAIQPALTFPDARRLPASKSDRHPG
jgi:hypothetical protein